MSIRAFFNAAAIAALLPIVAQAAPLTYNVNRTIGAGSVVGTITTDGTLGTLSTASITDWSLTLNDGLTSFLLSSANSGRFVDGAALSADADSIDFDFDAASGVLLFQNPAPGMGPNFWCVEVTGCSAFDTPREAVATGGETVFAERSGQISIATIGTNQVPEPATLALVGLALLGVATTRLRRA